MAYDLKRSEKAGPLSQGACTQGLQGRPLRKVSSMPVYVSLDTQFENLGDEVINALLLRETARRARLRIFTGKAPDWYRANIASWLPAGAPQAEFLRGRARGLLRLLLGSLLPPGSVMLLSCGDVTRARPNRKRDRAMGLLSRLPFLEIAQIGASRLQAGRSEQAWLQRAADRSGKITVRDGYSLQALQAAGIRAGIVPDLAFLLDFAPSGRGGKALFMFRDPGTGAEAFAEHLAPLVAQAREMGLDPVFGWQVARDEACNRRLAALTGAGILPLPGSCEGRLDAALEAYGEAAVIVSNRLHGLLIAASRGAIPVPLLNSGEQKIRGVFEQAGLAPLILEAGAPADANAGALAGFVADRGTWRGTLAQAFAANAAEIRKALDAFFGSSAVR